MQVATPEEKSERAAPSPSVVGSGEPSRACPICGRALSGRQKSACSDRCRATLSRSRRAEALQVRDQEVRKLLLAAIRILNEEEGR
jgi:predicted nucleic acid-binding Zn ribbon protein